MSHVAHAVLQGRQALLVGDDDLCAGIAARMAHAGAAIHRELVAEAAARVDQAVVPPVTGQGPLDILVVDVLGRATPARFESASTLAVQAALDRITLAVRILQASLPRLRQRGGRIILLGHRYGESVNEGLVAYNAAAWALVGVMRTAAVDWGPHQITTNLLLPFAATPEFEAAHAQRPKIVDLLLSQVPLRRAGDLTADVGGAVVFLASNDARFINGEVIHADGGQHVAGPVLNPIRFANPPVPAAPAS